jgi:N-acetylglucosaminyldiphosphoundecaprenol N-acetyl-beta-D-mannosaminyltransferase
MYNQKYPMTASFVKEGIPYKISEEKKVSTEIVMIPKVNRVKICGIPVDSLTMEQTLTIINKAIQEKRQLQHVVVNAAKVVNARKDQELKKAIEECDVINADGMSIVWALKLLNKPVPERVTGIDLMEELVVLAAEKNYKIYFLGAKQEVIKRVVEKYEQLHGSQIIAGYCNGFFAKEDELEVARQIAESGADILFVAMTSPKKEIFLNTYKSIIKVPFIMGVGGSFDVVSGLVKRAPLWMQRSGFEWLFRVIQEPGRMWKRYLTTNTAFIYLVLKEKFSLKRRSK